MVLVVSDVQPEAGSVRAKVVEELPCIRPHGVCLCGSGAVLGHNAHSYADKEEEE